MKPQRQSTDGFIPRRATRQIGGRVISDVNRPQTAPPATGLSGLRRPAGAAEQPGMRTTLRRSDEGLRRSTEGLRPTNTALVRADIDESLNSIGNEQPPEKKRRSRKVRKPKAPTTKRKKIIKWSVIGVLIIVLLIGGWLGYKVLRNSGNIFKGNIFGLVQSQPLKQDSNGRSNILVLGTSEDDPGHAGGDLTDSMMVVSIDQSGKTVSMFSIPRDLYVKYGMACPSGYEGKINAYFSCIETGTTPEAEQTRLSGTRTFVGEIFGMDIQYAVRVNNTVIQEAVDAVGGVDVKIEGNGPVPYGVEPGSILDRNFDWRCGYKCHLVKYSPGVHHLDGKHALFLSMARGDSAPTYGLVDSNFDREKNQQKIIIALKEKAVSSGTLSNISKVTGLMDALGDNLRTTFETSEIRTLMTLGTEIKSENIATIGLFDKDEPVVTTGSYGGASVVMPSAGIFTYSQIRQFLATKLSTNPVTREGAKIVVLNGSGVTGVAQTEADKLTAAGYIVDDIANAPEGVYPAITIYQVGEGMEKTKQKLAERFSVEVKTTAPPIAVTPDTNFVIVVGKDRSQN